MWLTVHLNSVKIKTQPDVTLCSTLFLFVNCSTCFGQFNAHHQDLTTEWCDRRVWYSSVAAEGCQQWTYYLLAGSDSLLQLRNYTTHGDHTTQSSAPDDGHWIAPNMLSSLQREIKYYTTWHLVGFLSSQNIKGVGSDGMHRNQVRLDRNQPQSVVYMAVRMLILHNGLIYFL